MKALDRYAFNAAYNAAQLASRVSCGTIGTSEYIASLALGIADAEELEEFKWEDHASFDDVADKLVEGTDFWNIDFGGTDKEINARRSRAFNITLASATNLLPNNP
jgi:hypothetical protein